MGKKRVADWSDEDQQALDRRAWPKGEWDSEPDVMTWRLHGFVAQAIRQRTGNLCGYLLLPKKHPWHGRRADNRPMTALKVHGGITYSRQAPAGDGWVVGFDCAHAGDLVPGFLHWGFSRKAVYRNMQYVQFCLDDLAAKAKKAQQRATVRVADAKTGEKK